MDVVFISLGEVDLPGEVGGTGDSEDGPDDVGGGTGSDERRRVVGRFVLGDLRCTEARVVLALITFASRSAKSMTGSSVVPLTTSSGTISDQFTDAASNGAWLSPSLLPLMTGGVVLGLSKVA